MIVEKFKPDDLDLMRVQQAQIGELVMLGPQVREALATYPAFTGFVDGVPIACAGMVEGALAIGGMWAILSEDARRHMLTLTRAGLRMLALYHYRRVETNVPVDFIAGCRWIGILGFECEGVMRKYAPDGSDQYRYARVA